MDSILIYQAANDLVQNTGTRNIKRIARSCSLDILETPRFKDVLGFLSLHFDKPLILHCSSMYTEHIFSTLTTKTSGITLRSLLSSTALPTALWLITRENCTHFRSICTHSTKCGVL